jgi:DNA-binding response OmpR family regulator
VKKNILVVDDDIDILKSVKEIFEHQGYEVITANDGIRCIEKLEDGFKGILIIDLMMPKLDGWDTIREIINRGLEKYVDIFVITAVGTISRKKMKGLEPYIHDYIVKPFNVNELIENINKIT